VLDDHSPITNYSASQATATCGNSLLKVQGNFFQQVLTDKYPKVCLINTRQKIMPSVLWTLGIEVDGKGPLEANTD
jgi:hypothetical protein